MHLQRVWHERRAGAPRGTGGPPTYSVAVVADFDDEVVLPEVPHRRSAARAGRRQDVLDLPVPRHAADVLQRLQDGHGELRTRSGASLPFTVEDSCT